MKRSADQFFTHRVAVPFLAILCCLLWGSAFPCIKTGYALFEIAGDDYRTQILFAGIRFAAAGLMVIAVGSGMKRRFLLPKKENVGRVFLLAAVQTVLQYVFFYIGLAHTSGVNGSIINGAGALFSIFLACLVGGERFTFNKIFGCLIGFGGVVLASVWTGQIGGFAFTGEGFILISSVSYAVSGLLIKRFSQREDAVTLSGYQFFIGGMAMVVVGLILGGRIRTVTVGGVFLMGYLAFLSAAAYTLWGVLLSHNPVSKVTVYGFVIPVAGSLLSTLVLKEYSSVSYMTAIALCLVTVGIFLVNYVRKNTARPPRFPKKRNKKIRENNG